MVKVSEQLKRVSNQRLPTRTERRLERIQRAKDERLMQSKISSLSQRFKNISSIEEYKKQYQTLPDEYKKYFSSPQTIQQKIKLKRTQDEIKLEKAIAGWERKSQQYHEKGVKASNDDRDKQADRYFEREEEYDRKIDAAREAFVKGATLEQAFKSGRFAERKQLLKFEAKQKPVERTSSISVQFGSGAQPPSQQLVEETTEVKADIQKSDELIPTTPSIEEQYGKQDYSIITKPIGFVWDKTKEYGSKFIDEFFRTKQLKKDLSKYTYKLDVKQIKPFGKDLYKFTVPTGIQLVDRGSIPFKEVDDSGEVKSLDLMAGLELGFSTMPRRLGKIQENELKFQTTSTAKKILEEKDYIDTEEEYKVDVEKFGESLQTKSEGAVQDYIRSNPNATQGDINVFVNEVNKELQDDYQKYITKKHNEYTAGWEKGIKEVGIENIQKNVWKQMQETGTPFFGLPRAIDVPLDIYGNKLKVDIPTQERVAYDPLITKYLKSFPEDRVAVTQFVPKEFTAVYTGLVTAPVAIKGLQSGVGKITTGTMQYLPTAETQALLKMAQFGYGSYLAKELIPSKLTINEKTYNAPSALQAIGVGGAYDVEQPFISGQFKKTAFGALGAYIAGKQAIATLSNIKSKALGQVGRMKIDTPVYDKKTNKLIGFRRQSYSVEKLRGKERLPTSFVPGGKSAIYYPKTQQIRFVTQVPKFDIYNPKTWGWKLAGKKAGTFYGKWTVKYPISSFTITPTAAQGYGGVGTLVMGEPISKSKFIKLANSAKANFVKVKLISGKIVYYPKVNILDVGSSARSPTALQEKYYKNLFGYQTHTSLQRFKFERTIKTAQGTTFKIAKIIKPEDVAKRGGFSLYTLPETAGQGPRFIQTIPISGSESGFTVSLFGDKLNKDIILFAKQKGGQYTVATEKQLQQLIKQLGKTTQKGALATTSELQYVYSEGGYLFASPSLSNIGAQSSIINTYSDARILQDSQEIVKQIYKMGGIKTSTGVAKSSKNIAKIIEESLKGMSGTAVTSGSQLTSYSIVPLLDIISKSIRSQTTISAPSAPSISGISGISSSSKTTLKSIPSSPSSPSIPSLPIIPSQPSPPSIPSKPYIPSAPPSYPYGISAFLFGKGKKKKKRKKPKYELAYFPGLTAKAFGLDPIVLKNQKQANKLIKQVETGFTLRQPVVRQLTKNEKNNLKRMKKMRSKQINKVVL